MSNMILGSYTFDKNPMRVSGVINPDVIKSVVRTIGDVAVFSWGAQIPGRTIILNWDYVSTEQFAELSSIYQADESVEFDPQDGEGKTYNVEVMNLIGTYFISLSDSQNRQNVELTLLILGEL